MAEIMVEREKDDNKKKTKGKAGFFFQFLPLISSSPGHGIHPYLYGVEERHVVF